MSSQAHTPAIVADKHLLPLQVTRHDIGDKSAVGTLSEAYPHLIFEHFGSQLGERVRLIRPMLAFAHRLGRKM